MKKFASEFKLIFGIIIILMFSLVSICAADQNEIKVGVTMPLSGPLAFAGQRELNGMKLAVKKINDDGGILNGKKIKLIVYDDKGNPEEAVSTIKKLINRDKVVACVSGAISTPALAQKEVSREAKMVHVIVTAQHPKITEEGHPYLFRLNSTIPQGADALCKYVAEKMKPKTAWYIGVNDDFGRFMAKRYESNFAKYGIKLLGVEYYNKDDSDFMVYLLKGKALNPNIIMMAAPADTIAATILKQRRQIKFDAMITESMGTLTQDLVKLAGKDASDNVYSVDSWLKSLNNDSNKWFVKAFEKEFKPNPANKESAIAFEAVMFLAQAMNKAGSAKDADKISKIFKTTVFKGPRGDITFDDKGQAMATNYPIVARNMEIIVAK